MKKLIIIILGLGVVVGLIIIANQVSTDAKATDTSLIAFAVKDTAEVDRLEIYDSYKDATMTLVRNEEGIWTDEEGNCVQQDIVGMMLETMVKITLKGYVPEAARENMRKMMMANHKKVKIFKDGEWVKTWYVGHATQDHMGTHMLLETPERRSDHPVIMGMKGFYGILDPRFFADPRRFACTDLFSFKRTDLKKIEVINRVDPRESYEIRRNNGRYEVTSQGQKIEAINEDNLLFYLNGFEDIHYNQPNYTLSTAQIDSIKNQPPDYELNIDGVQNSYELELYRRPDPKEKNQDSLIYDKDYMWGVKEDGKLVRMQYYSIGPLIQGKTVFVNN
ncbi:MAG: hypothetical protein ACQERC_07315 [Bacteroidota bacterium]